MNIKVSIDPGSGFCFGVVYAIQMAEEELDRSGELYCLGDIVHNNMEVERLKAKGLRIITHTELENLHNCKVLIRAHGEPPETYKTALKNNIELIDASCPVVLKLQNRVRNNYEDINDDEGQVVIYGEAGHAEVNGLVGQTGGSAIVVKEEKDLDKIDFSKPVYFFSQTTKSTKGFAHMKHMIEQRIEQAGQKSDSLISNDTLCRQVSNREPHLKKFAKDHEVIIFVSGRKSSNGKALFSVCQAVNDKSYFISELSELNPNWVEGAASVGICGATSTPLWLMENIAEAIQKTVAAKQII
jgi:4-hydroxy-3-methylbut-2-en-1-yl diphosphate reductase